MMSKALAKHKDEDCTIGVVGGGQLAQMLAIAANERNIRLIVQTPSEADPAVSSSSDFLAFATADVEGTRKLAKRCDSIIFENEWINIEKLASLEDEKLTFVPSLSAISPLIEKISQRKLLNSLNLPCPQWLPLSEFRINDFKLPNRWKFPLMAKCSKGGYDGKGTRIIHDFKELKKLLLSVKPKGWLVEQWVAYDIELSLVLSRDKNGFINSYPLFETHQFNQVCDWVLGPADVPHSVNAMAYNIGASLLRELNYVGVLAIEFFYGNDGLLINEIAPRTHNSAHLTIEACNSSQFDQHICIASGLDVPNPEFNCAGALMVNLLGLPYPNINIEERLSLLKKIEGASLHWYGKTKQTPGRKLGHVTLLLHEPDSHLRRNKALNAIKDIRSIWPLYDSGLS